MFDAVEKLGTRKRSLPEESVSGGDVGQVQPKITQSKRARTSPAKTPESTTTAPRYSFMASYLLVSRNHGIVAVDFNLFVCRFLPLLPLY